MNRKKAHICTNTFWIRYENVVRIVANWTNSYLWYQKKNDLLFLCHTNIKNVEFLSCTFWESSIIISISVTFGSSCVLTLWIPFNKDKLQIASRYNATANKQNGSALLCISSNTIETFCNELNIKRRTCTNIIVFAPPHFCICLNECVCVNHCQQIYC